MEWPFPPRVHALRVDDLLSDDNLDLMNSTIIPKLSYLNVNMIRVYQVSPSNSHVKAMHTLARNGIYVMVGLATSTHSVKQMTGEYSQSTFDHAARLVDEFQAYDNTLCFSVGNEVEFPGQQAANLKAENPGRTSADIVRMTIALELKVAQAMRSFARDVKNHIRINGYRPIPVGCAMQDGPQTSWESTNPNAYQVGLIGTDIIAQYYASGDASERMDYIGINTYRYVPGGPMSAYDGLACEATPLPVPVILTETGGLGGQRTWEIVPKLYTRAQLYPQLSGQVAFQMLEEGAGYGLFDVHYNGGTVTLTATANGGAGDLSSEFGTAAREPLKPVAITPIVSNHTAGFGGKQSHHQHHLAHRTVAAQDLSVTQCHDHGGELRGCRGSDYSERQSHGNCRFGSFRHSAHLRQGAR